MADLYSAKLCYKLCFVISKWSKGLCYFVRAFTNVAGQLRVSWLGSCFFPLVKACFVNGGWRFDWQEVKSSPCKGGKLEEVDGTALKCSRWPPSTSSAHCPIPRLQ